MRLDTGLRLRYAVSRTFVKYFYKRNGVTALSAVHLEKERMTMKFFIDTANVEEIRKANDMGVIAGVTTNPSLIAK